jgi:hypothetical protein
MHHISHDLKLAKSYFLMVDNQHKRGDSIAQQPCPMPALALKRTSY